MTVLGGADTIRQCLWAGLVDELDIDIMPAILGGGLRVFEANGDEPIRLERMKVTELPACRTHLRFRVVT